LRTGRAPLNSKRMERVLRLSVNGQARETREGTSLAALLEQLAIDAHKVAIERNLHIVPRSLYGEIRLEQGDRLEIVQFVGGG
jgi:thiamine biosynthesis protein ThiS